MQKIALLMANEIGGWLGRKRRGEIGMPRTVADMQTDFEQQQTEEQTFQFMKLPPEIQRKIFLELPIQMSRKCRQVCSAWRDLIDTSLEFSLIFNDNKNNYAGVEFPPWRITRCFIGSYVDDNLEFLPNPDTLHVLNIWGNITSSNFLRLLEKTLKLEELNLANHALSYNRSLFELNGVPQQVNLNQLRKFTLYSRESLPKIEKNLSGVLRQNMPNLMKLKIIVEPSRDFDFTPTDYLESRLGVEVATNIAIFVSQQRQLKTIHLVIVPFINVYEEIVNRLVLQLNESHNLENNLAQLRLHNCRFKVSPFFVKLFERLFAAQSNLKDIRMEIPFRDRMPVRYSTLEGYIRSSMPTLVSIHLQWLPGHPVANNDVPIDFSMFNFAPNLKRIAISRKTWSSRGRDDSQHGIIANVHRLPPSLEVLELDGFRCRSDELKMVADSPYLQNLCVIRIVDAGWTHIGFGIDGGVAQAMCSKSSLHVLTIGPLKNRIPERGEDPEFPVLRNTLYNTNFRFGKMVTFDFQRFRRECASRAKEGRRAMYGRTQSCSFNLLSTTL